MNASCHTPSLVTSNLIAFAGRLVLLALVLLLLGLASTGKCSRRWPGRS